METELILDWPPTVNSYYTHVTKGKRVLTFISKRGKDYRNQVAEDVREQLADWPTFEIPLHVEVMLFPPDKRKRDLDNHMKGLLDALTHAEVWDDDSLIDQLFIYRGVIVPKGRCVVRINDAGPLIPRQYNMLDQ